ncbi:MAG: prepilin-type N-terminal cleavage/methylation domain-containing protein [bacterium]|nr:prepilin-type N-terminal cleavage/methylation domain-containing protein [bacterium]
MRKLLNRKRGFTLIELMIVVAIIGILAAIAIPNFLRFQLRSKTGEARTNLAGIRTAEESYFAEYGVYIAQSAGVPATGGTNQKTAWSTGTGFDTMGWAPEGSVFFQYAVTINGASTDYTAESASDLDGDAVFSDFVYVHPIPAATAGSAAAGLGDGNCAATGAYNANGGAQDLLNAVGACEAMDGQSQF